MNIEEFEDVFRSHYSPLVSYVRTMVADEDDCHDIVGMAFENILKNLGRIERAKAGAYLYTATTNHAINFLRRRKLQRRYAEHFLKTAQMATSEEMQQGYEDRMKTAMKVIEDIGEPTRSILVSCYIDGKKYREVAEEMGVSVSMIKKHIVKALKILDAYRKKYEKM